MYFAGVYGFAASVSKNCSSNSENVSFPFSVKWSESVGCPTNCKKSSMMNAPLCDSRTAVSIAGANSSGESTLFTPLLPAESTGFTMTGQVKYSVSLRGADLSV